MSKGNGSDDRHRAPVADRLRAAVEGVPEGASLTLPVDVLKDWLEAAADATETGIESPGRPVADLSVGEIAEAHGKAPSTVRGWLQDVPGTYRLGNELRVPRSAWRAYLDGLAQDDDGPDGPPEVRSGDADLGGWRDEREGAA